MTPVRLHLLLLAAYLLLGCAVTAGDTAALRGSFIDLSGIVSHYYWGAAAAVAVLSSLMLPYARGRNGVVLGAHAGSIVLAFLGSFVVLASSIDVQPRIQSQRAVAEAVASNTAAAARCLALESWSWEERPRGTLHLTLKVERRVADPIEVQVTGLKRTTDSKKQLLPGDTAGQHVVMNFIVARIDPEPFEYLDFGFFCPGVYLTYSTNPNESVANTTFVERPLPAPTQGGAAAGVLRGYDLILFAALKEPRFLLRPASNESTPHTWDPQWLSTDILDATLSKLPPHQTIGSWVLDGRREVDDVRAFDATVVRRGHKLVIH